MFSKRLRDLIATHFVWWCVAWVLLAALQPFIAVHFRQDGWEDEPGFRVRASGTVAQFEPDDRTDHPTDLEATVFVPTGAGIDLPDVLHDGLDLLMALVLLALPLAIALVRLVFPVADQPRPRRPERNSGPPPPWLCWRITPPQTAPPLTT